MIGRPDLGEDERFATMAGRNDNRDELLPMLEEVFRARTADEWIDALVAAGVPASRVNTVEEALVDPQTIAREDIVEHDHPTLGRVRSIRTPLRLADGAERLERDPARGAVPRRAHRARAGRALRLHAGARARARRGGRVRGRAVTARDLVGYGRQPPDPRWPGWSAHRAQLRPQLRGRAASGRRSRAIRPRRRSCTRWSARRRPSAGATSTPSRCSSSAAVPASGACIASSPPTACR